MPFYTKSEQCIFFSHIPKTGGFSLKLFFEANKYTECFSSSSLDEACEQICSPQHRHSQDVELLKELSLRRLTYSFTVIRNPIERLISEFFYRIPKSYYTFCTSQMFSQWTKDIFNLYTKNNFINDNHIRPQHEFIFNNMEIFKFGETNKIIKKLQTIDPFINTYMPHENKGTPNLENAKMKWDIPNQTLNLIKEFYKKDFDLFNSV